MDESECSILIGLDSSYGDDRRWTLSMGLDSSYGDEVILRAVKSQGEARSICSPGSTYITDKSLIIGRYLNVNLSKAEATFIQSTRMQRFLKTI